MKKNAIEWEERRLRGIGHIRDYPWFKERHRVFPALFEDRQHKKIIDLSAGVGCAAARIREYYPADLVCNDISPTCLKILGEQGIRTVSFDIDDQEKPFPFPDNNFDTVISLVTIEHLIHPEHFLKEVHRILMNEGYFYIATPNYAAPEYALKLLLSGRTFHDPMFSEESRYEFYSHVRYYTYKTLLDFVRSFGFAPDSVYLAIPEGSARYRALQSKSRFKAFMYRNIMRMKHRLLAPRFASEPILCFQKKQVQGRPKIRKVVL